MALSRVSEWSLSSAHKCKGSTFSPLSSFVFANFVALRNANKLQKMARTPPFMNIVDHDRSAYGTSDKAKISRTMICNKCFGSF
jgi:hypothetical protein